MSILFDNLTSDLIFPDNIHVLETLNMLRGQLIRRTHCLETNHQVLDGTQLYTMAATSDEANACIDILEAIHKLCP